MLAGMSLRFTPTQVTLIFGGPNSKCKEVLVAWVHVGSVTKLLMLYWKPSKNINLRAGEALQKTEHIPFCTCHVRCSSLSQSVVYGTSGRV